MNPRERAERALRHAPLIMTTKTKTLRLVEQEIIEATKQARESVNMKKSERLERIVHLLSQAREELLLAQASIKCTPRQMSLIDQIISHCARRYNSKGKQ